MSELQVQVVEGRAWEPSRKFSPGAPVGPLGVGASGEWVVEGPGVAPIHAYLYFDGVSLMVATAPPSVTTLNGAPVGSDWTPMAAPCEVRLGGARLQVQAAVGGGSFDDMPTNARPGEMNEDVATAFYDKSTGEVSSPAMRAPGPAANRRPPPADESTAYMPIEQLRGNEPSGAAPAPGGLPPSGVIPETIRKPLNPSVLAPTIAPGQIPTPQIEPPPTPMAPPGAKAGPAELWRAASTPRKITYLLAPVALIAFALTMLDDPPPPPKGAKGAGSAKASASASSAPPPPSPIGSMAEMPTGPLLPAPARSVAPTKSRLPAPPPTKVPHTTERKAVDAVLAGDYAQAIALYEELARQNPEVPTYREAIRILKQKQAGK